MKQKLCLWGCYCLKRIQPKYHVCRKSILEVRNILTGYAALILRKRTYTIVHYSYITSTLPVLEICIALTKTFSILGATFSRMLRALDVSQLREIVTYRPHTKCAHHVGWSDNGRGEVE